VRGDARKIGWRQRCGRPWLQSWM